MEISKIGNKPLLSFAQSKKKEDGKTSFGELFKSSLKNVNILQNQANKAGEDLALGKVENIHEVMISAQKAKLSLDLTTAITRKAVTAYQEIMRLQV